MKSFAAKKSMPGATTKGMKHHVKGCLEDSSPYWHILHVGTNNYKNKKSAEDIANDIINLEISIRNEKNNVFVSGVTIQNDWLNSKRKNVISLLQRKCDEEKICFANNTNINVIMLNSSGLHLKGTWNHILQKKALTGLQLINLQKRNNKKTTKRRNLGSNGKI